MEDNENAQDFKKEEYKHYHMLKDHINSDVVDIYMIASIMIKDYNNTDGWWYQTLKALICLVAQLFLPTLVIYDEITTMMHEESSGYCPSTGTWQDKAASCVISMFLVIYYVHQWYPFTYRLFEGHIDHEYPGAKITGIIRLLFTQRLDRYLSEAIFTLGTIAKILVHCLNTLASIIILFKTTSTMDLIINSCVMYYFNDISRMIVDDSLKIKCCYYLKKRYKHIVENNLYREPEEITYRKWIDHKTGIIGLIFAILIFPLLGVSVLLATLGSIIYMPICHP